MKLIDLLRPRWKHSDPAIRAEAVRHLRNQTVLAAISAEDPSELVRIAAVETLTDQPALALIATNNGSPALAAVRRLTDRALLATVAMDAELPEVRALAVDRIEDAVVLHRIATSDPDQTVRLRARAKNTAADLAFAFVKSLLSKLEIAEAKAERSAEYCGTLDDLCHALIEDPRFLINGEVVPDDADGAARLQNPTNEPWGPATAGSDRMFTRFLAQIRGDDVDSSEAASASPGRYYQIKVWRTEQDSFGAVAEKKKLAATHDAVAWGRASNEGAETRPVAGLTGHPTDNS